MLTPPKEIITRKFVCDDCPSLKTKWWEFYGENDDHDSGTSAICLIVDNEIGESGVRGRAITGYWHKGYECPQWCPRLPKEK